MTHEFGHYTNLGHVELNGQLANHSEGGDNSGPTPDDPFPFLAGGLPTEEIESMYPFYLGDQAGTRSPHADDRASIATLYPGATFFATTGTISGTIFAADGVTAVAGRFSNPILATLPGPEEYWNTGEASDSPPDDPLDSTSIFPVAGSPTTGIDIIFNQPAPGGPLGVGDDGSVQLALPFAYNICGQEFNSVFVNANGNLTFGAGDADWSESVGEFLAGDPRIAPLWDDLSPNNGGTISVEFDAGEATVIFDSVPEFFATGANSFMVTMRSDGSYTIEYGAISATDGLSGTTEGGGAADPGPADLSAGGPYSAAGTIYEDAAGDLGSLMLDFDP